MPHAASTSARARKSWRSTVPEPLVDIRLRIVISISGTTVSPSTPGSFAKRFERALEHVDVHVRDRAEAAALDQHRLLVEHLGRLQHLAVGGEHRRAGEAELHQLQAHHAVVDVAELDARELDHVDLDALGREVVEQRLDQLLGLVVEEERAVDAGSRRRCRAPPAAPPSRVSSMRTWMMIWLSSSRGCDWKRMPIQPWHSLVPLKPRAETVSAKAKNAVVLPRRSRSRSRFRSCS